MASASRRGGRQPVSVEVFAKILRKVAVEVAALESRVAALENAAPIQRAANAMLARELPGHPIDDSLVDFGEGASMGFNPS